MIVALEGKAPKGAFKISEKALKKMFDTDIMDMDKIIRQMILEIIEFLILAYKVDIELSDYTGDMDKLKLEIEKIGVFYMTNITIL